MVTVVAGSWWYQSDSVAARFLRFKPAWFCRPFDKRQVALTRLGFAAYLVLFPFCWFFPMPHWWVYPVVFDVLSWGLGLVRIGPRRRRQLLGLLQPDSSGLSAEEVYALNGRPGEPAQQAWLRSRQPT